MSQQQQRTVATGGPGLRLHDQTCNHGPSAPQDQRLLHPGCICDQTQERPLIFCCPLSAHNHWGFRSVFVLNSMFVSLPPHGVVHITREGEVPVSNEANATPQNEPCQNSTGVYRLNLVLARQEHGVDAGYAEDSPASRSGRQVERRFKVQTRFSPTTESTERGYALFAACCSLPVRQKEIGRRNSQDEPS